MNEEMKAIVFSLGDERYGVDVTHVRTIERMQSLTRVPKTPPFVKGVMNLRGIVVPVIDLRGRFQLPEHSYTEHTRIIIVAINDMEVGMIVDNANDVVDVDPGQIEEPPEIVGGIRAKYLRGLLKLGEDRLLVLLNLEEVLNKSEVVQLEQMGE